MAIGTRGRGRRLTLVDIAAPQTDRELQREVAISEGRAGLERMLREVRNADS